MSKRLGAAFPAMALTADMVYQGLVLSSIFLMAISLPKLCIYTIWSSMRLFVYRHKMGSKYLRRVVSKKTVKQSAKPNWQLQQETREIDSYVRDVKKPMVELLAACLILPLSAAGLHVEPDAGQLIIAMEIAMVIVFVMTAAIFKRRFDKLVELMGGGPLI